MKFNIFKKKEPITSTGEKEALLKMKAPDPWQDPPTDPIPMPEVEPPASEPEPEEKSLVKTLTRATANRSITWAWEVEGQRYYVVLNKYDPRMFTIKSESDNLRPIETITLRYIASGIVTSWADHPDIISLYRVIHSIALEDHDKHKLDDMKLIEEELTKTGGKE